MRLSKVNLANAFDTFEEAWSPRRAGAVNDFDVKIVKLRGEFLWHHHETEDELFLVTHGTLRMQLRPEDGGDIDLHEGEFLVVPHGVEHCPLAMTDEVHCVLIEQSSTVNTGTVVNGRTVAPQPLSRGATA
jgi:mannose-6-phosphate isomerase-like protein (cupin superfamily)